MHSTCAHLGININKKKSTKHEVEACVGSEFVYVAIALAAAVFHSCLLLICLTGVLHMVVQIIFVNRTTDPGIV